MGDSGRLQVPADLCRRLHPSPGTRLVMLEIPEGLLLLSRPQLRDLVRRDLAGLAWTGDLIAEHRAAATRDHQP